jgi:spheroidene monooxygenase
MTLAPAPVGPGGQIASLCFFRFPGLRDRVWAFGQMGLARGPLRRTPGIGFVKLMGAGTGEGFTPLPDTGAVAILATWPDLATAEAQVGGPHGGGAPVFRRYRARASEAFALFLAPTAARGLWSGATPFRPGPPGPGPVAALTRASVRPRALVRFWARAPAISRRIGADPNVLFKAGVGEIPLLHQVTVSIWPDAAAMAAFARAEGPHAAAIRAVRAEGWFAEELYARFTVRARWGSWGGVDPLAQAGPALAAE